MNKIRTWVECKAVFDYNDDLGIDHSKESFSENLEYFDFDLNEVIAYNQSSVEGFTNIWFNTSSITINIPMKKLRKMIKGNNVLNYKKLLS